MHIINTQAWILMEHFRRVMSHATGNFNMLDIVAWRVDPAQVFFFSFFSSFGSFMLLLFVVRRSIYWH
jgi:hypothetical protein